MMLDRLVALFRYLSLLAAPARSIGLMNFQPASWKVLDVMREMSRGSPLTYRICGAHGRSRSCSARIMS